MSKTKYLADAKMHKRPVEQGYVETIFAVVGSTRYQKGILISPVGFTDGALKFAKANGVGLLVVPANFDALAIKARDRSVARLQLADLAQQQPSIRTDYKVLHKNYSTATDAKVVSRPPRRGVASQAEVRGLPSGGRSNKMMGSGRSSGSAGRENKGGGPGGASRKG